ncbi:MAG TPA: CheR family methyltransferase, partial [Tepidisphaeraceae bacterium]
ITACSSGEEAYTLAMLIAEVAEHLGKQLDIKIFATDTAERSLQQARAGAYPMGIEAEVSAERLERFFERDDALYRVKKELREMVVFAPQNVLQDPPFSRLDICTCRNLLIYLEPDMQRRVLALIHFGLRDGGALFLGTSETAGGIDEMFEPVDKKWRIFRRVGPTRHGAVEFPLPRLAALLAEREREYGRPPTARASVVQLTHRALLERYAPAAVAIDREHRVVYFHGQADRFLVQPQGEPTRELLQLCRDSVRGAVHAALDQALEDGVEGTGHARDGIIETDQGRRRVWVTVSPLEPRTSSGFLLVSFEEREELAPVPPPPLTRGGAAGQVEHQALREELQRIRDELQSTIQELQGSNEELKASNEEVTSINEELQSTNEELETSKEELQSLNEELTTVNAQLEGKVEELEAMSNDLASLLSSTDIAVIFLDTRFRIRRYTPAVRDLMDIIPSDLGRPLSDLARKFTDPDLAPDAQVVLERLIPIEREVASASGRWYVRRVLPYRTQDNRIEGVVVTFVDITARREAEERYRLIFEGVRDYAIFALDTQGRITTWNPGAERVLGYPASEAVGQGGAFVYTSEDRAARAFEERIAEAAATGRSAADHCLVRRDGSRIIVSGVLSAVRDSVLGLRGFVEVLRDVSTQQDREDGLRTDRATAQAANLAKDQFLAMASHELRTPLSAMLVWSAALRRVIESKEIDRDELREAVEAIEHSARAQKHLIEDLLDTTRIASGKLRLDPRETDLANLVRAATDAVRKAAEQKGVAVKSELSAAVGVVMADPERIEQIVWNLLDNAVKFTPADGRVDVRLAREGDQVTIEVADTGKGIAPDFLPRLFERFSQAEGGIGRGKGGLGLGLAISRQLVQLHGGTIQAQSQGAGKGATFTVRLPLPAVKSV